MAQIIFYVYKVHKIENTSGVSKSSYDWLKSIGFQRDLCVVIFNGSSRKQSRRDAKPPYGNRKLVFITVTISFYHDQLNTVFSKLFEMCDIHSLKYVHRHMMLNKTNCDWLFFKSVS